MSHNDSSHSDGDAVKEGAGVFVFGLFLLVSTGNLLLMMPAERGASPLLQSVPFILLAIPIVLSAGLHVALFAVVAGAMTATARLLVPGSRLSRFREAARVTGMAHAPLLLWALVTSIVVGVNASDADELSTPLVVVANLRPWAWWGTAVVLLAGAMMTEREWRAGARIGLPIVVLLAATNMLLVWVAS